ncbi:zinc finger, CCHC-type containing protein [Tanacetum coccineum]
MHVVMPNTQKTNNTLLPSTRRVSYTYARRSQPKSNIRTDRIQRPSSRSQKNKVEDQHRKFESSSNKNNHVLDCNVNVKNVALSSNSEIDEHLDRFWRKYTGLGLNWRRNRQDHDPTPTILKKISQTVETASQTIRDDLTSLNRQRDEKPIRTLGDYSKPSHEGYRNTIELPKGTMWCLCDPTPYVDSLDLDVANRERTRLRLFQFSLRDQASNWLERLLAGSISTWKDLTTRFHAQFFPLGRTAKPHNDILMF